MVVGEDPWAQFAFGPLLKHGGARRPDCGLSMCEAQVSRRSRRGPAR
jgi:hypothetical protein